MADKSEKEFEELVEACVPYYEAGVAPTLAELRQLNDEEFAAMREACRRVRSQEIGALARAIQDPIYAVALGGDKEELAEIAMTAGLAASRRAVNEARHGHK